MNSKIAIDPTLSTFKNYLTGKGYDVETLNLSGSSNLLGFDAIVVTGLNSNILGMHVRRRRPL